MQVLFESRDVHADPLRELAENRVRFAMRRLSWLVPRARIQLSDLNGPRGGLDKRCRVEVNTQGSGSVVITSVARDWRHAIDEAVARATRSLVRVWRRSQARGHATPRGPHARIAHNARLAA
jgi:ribosome-associated translation inhibitor RaiA